MIGYWLKARFSFLNKIADWWNLKVRIPLARCAAKCLSLTYRKKHRNQMINLLFKLLVTLITLFIMMSFMTIYVTPVLFYVALPKGVQTWYWTFLVVGCTYIIFEEEVRFLRKIGQALDEMSEVNPFGKNILYRWPFNIDRNKLNINKKVIAVIIVIIVSVVSMQLGAAWDNAHTQNTSENVQLINNIATAHPFVLLFITWILAPVVEECFFRGIIMRILMGEGNDFDNTSDRALKNQKALTFFAVLGSSILFSLSHSPNTVGYFLGILIAGIALGSLTVYTGRIKYSVYAHMSINITSSLFSVVVGLLLELIK